MEIVIRCAVQGCKSTFSHKTNPRTPSASETAFRQALKDGWQYVTYELVAVRADEFRCPVHALVPEEEKNA